MNNFNELAKEFHSRNNKRLIGVCVGEVVSLTPVTIQVYYGGEPVTYTEFFNTKDMINGEYDKTEGDLYVDEYPVNIGDKFICIVGNDNQGLYLISPYERIKDLFIYLK